MAEKKVEQSNSASLHIFIQQANAVTGISQDKLKMLILATRTDFPQLVLASGKAIEQSADKWIAFVNECSDEECIEAISQMREIALQKIDSLLFDS